jgi:mannose-6-phosphate isomerase-like protein (cupin superfamily)
MSETIILPPGGGRTYTIEAMHGVFKADEQAYCASEWFVEPGGSGAGAHSHEAQDEIFLVTEGTMWLLADDDWVEAPTGIFLRIPAGVTHDFENRGAQRATAFNVFIPGGGFEAGFARWGGVTDVLGALEVLTAPIRGARRCPSEPRRCSIAA